MVVQKLFLSRQYFKCEKCSHHSLIYAIEQFSPRDFQLNQPKLICPTSTEAWQLSDVVQFCKYAKRGASEVI